MKSETLLQKQKRKSYYDQTAKPLPPIEKEEIIATNPVQRILQELQNPTL